MNSSAGALFLWQHFDTWLSFVIRYPYMSEHTRNETGGILDVRDGHALRCSPWSTRPPERQKLRERRDALGCHERTERASCYQRCACRVAADARVALRRFLHLEIDVNVAPRIAERRNTAAENDDFPDVRVVLANINHPPDVCLLRREDACDVLIRFCKYVPHARERNCRHHHHLILFYQNTLILSFARKYQSDAPMAIAVIIPSCK